MENKHIEYPSMPFDIDDTVYRMEKVSKNEYKVSKLKCAGYWNLGFGWQIAFKVKEGNLFSTDLTAFSITNAGYTLFKTEAECLKRIKELNGKVV